MADTNIWRLQIQFRRDTAANWELHKNVVPAAGEPCFVVDKNILKIGDGVKTFEQLEPINDVKFELAADGKSLVLEDNVLKLMGFDSADVGAQPRVGDDGSLEWIVPAVTVDELNETVKTLKTDIADLQTLVGSSDFGSGTLLSRVEGLENKIDGVGEGTIDAKINAKINDFASKMSDDGTVNTLKELVDYVANHGGEIDTLVADVMTLQQLVGGESVREQVANAIKNSGHITKEEAATTLLSKIDAQSTYMSKVEAAATLENVKYEISHKPVGTLVDYRDKEIRVMVPSNAQFVKQNVGDGGDANTYYITFNTYAPNDNAVGYREYLGNQADSEILTKFSTDEYGRRYQSTWLGVAKYDESTDSWSYYGKSSTANKYIGWNYRIDWYDKNGVVIDSYGTRINLSNEMCHNSIEPFYMGSVVKGVKVNGTLLDVIDGVVNVDIAEQTLCVKGSDEIDVAEDGTLNIKKIGFDKIVQDKNTIIVMDGGNAV